MATSQSTNEALTANISGAAFNSHNGAKKRLRGVAPSPQAAVAGESSPRKRRSKGGVEGNAKATGRAKKARDRREKARSSKPQPSADKPVTKGERIITLLKRSEGASIAEMMKATGWQAHSVRGFLSATAKRRMGLALVSERSDDGDRRYRIA